MVSSGVTGDVYVLAFDYRGFGNSTGSPTESGMITDAISVISWAMNVAGVSSDRIVLLAQSLGTALATAAASHFISLPTRIEFAGLVVCAAFPDAPTVFQAYSIGGYLPILAPLRTITFLQTWFERRFKDTWKTSNRVEALVRKSDKLTLTFIHATSDPIIPWRLTNELFYKAVSATTEEELTSEEIEEKRETTQLGDGGWTHIYRTGNKTIRTDIVRHGGKCKKRERVRTCQ
jgi:abhydrolase domain-containing protein 12